ncbi:MAG: hypothetical protein GF347_02285, partial [Candidatus Moranbacteria bacterium]|nr:hypothetical protein [Candidatus Moranbacteria bacterium]
GKKGKNVLVRTLLFCHFENFDFAKLKNGKKAGKADNDGSLLESSDLSEMLSVFYDIFKDDPAGIERLKNELVPIFHFLEINEGDKRRDFFIKNFRFLALGLDEIEKKFDWLKEFFDLKDEKVLSMLKKNPSIANLVTSDIEGKIEEWNQIGISEKCFKRIIAKTPSLLKKDISHISGVLNLCKRFSFDIEEESILSGITQNSKILLREPYFIFLKYLLDKFMGKPGLELRGVLASPRTKLDRFFKDLKPELRYDGSLGDLNKILDRFFKTFRSKFDETLNDENCSPDQFIPIIELFFGKAGDVLEEKKSGNLHYLMFFLDNFEEVSNEKELNYAWTNHLSLIKKSDPEPIFEPVEKSQADAPSHIVHSSRFETEEEELYYRLLDPRKKGEVYFEKNQKYSPLEIFSAYVLSRLEGQKYLDPEILKQGFKEKVSQLNDRLKRACLLKTYINFEILLQEVSETKDDEYPFTLEDLYSIIICSFGKPGEDRNAFRDLIEYMKGADPDWFSNYEWEWERTKSSIK